MYLSCEGWRCDCTLIPTTARHTRNALDAIQQALSGSKSLKYNENHDELGRFASGDGGGEFSEGGAQSIIGDISSNYDIKPGIEITESGIFDSSGNIDSLGTVRGGNIVINKDLMDSYDFGSDYNNTVCENWQDVVTHEYGHYIEETLMTDDAYADYGFGRPSYWYERGETPPESSQWARNLDQVAYNSGSSISEYATTNGEEYFAEAFVLYNRGSDYWSSIDSNLLSVFQRLDNRQ
jgi:hypothetical protein